ncbi:response regulator [Spirulina sp. 06S082]|uniref:hybrid sensor histidine kinase/response regulator n=1 Tax=Spirulina sp. 06S082 TaxID=3110248 RepID=UPI002B1EA42E|nr:response regulator [Spirulina sp. 06S082]MEA5471920.1 response regulator [Spirulina sp. 06S082]
MAELKELDLQKLAGKMASSLWSSVKNWDYFTQDTVGKEVAKAADSLWGENPDSQNGQTISIPIDDEEDNHNQSPVTRHPSSSIAISIDDEIETEGKDLTNQTIEKEVSASMPIDFDEEEIETDSGDFSSEITAETSQTIEKEVSASMPIDFDEEEIETDSSDFSSEITAETSQTIEKEVSASMPIDFDEEEIETDSNIQNLQTLEEEIFAFPDSLAIDLSDRNEEIKTENPSQTSPNPILTLPTMENQPLDNTPPDSQFQAPKIRPPKPLRNPEGYEYFLSESRELLAEIEQQLFALTPEASTNDIYSLMRATHTLKGAAANVGRETIKIIAHNLEDVFRAMLAPEAVIDQELESLLFEGYECLRMAISAELVQDADRDDDLLNRAADLFVKLQEKLGDCFDHQPPLPSSEELGFDLTKSIFEVGVSQRIEELKELLSKGANENAIASVLQDQANVFVGLGESLGLPGFGAIATAILSAIAAHPDRAREIARLALEDLKCAHKLVLEGDRDRGGQPSIMLLELAGESGTVSETTAIEAISSHNSEDFDELETGQDLEDLLAPSIVENTTFDDNEDPFSFIYSESTSELTSGFVPDINLDISEEFPLISPTEREELDASFEELEIQNGDDLLMEFDREEPIDFISEDEGFSDANFDSEFGELEFSETSGELEDINVNRLEDEAIFLEETFGNIGDIPDDFDVDVQSATVSEFSPEAAIVPEENINSVPAEQELIPSNIWDIEDNESGELLESELDLTEDTIPNKPQIKEEEIFLRDTEIPATQTNLDAIPSLEETFGAFDLTENSLDVSEETEPIFLDDPPPLQAKTKQKRENIQQEIVTKNPVKPTIESIPPAKTIAKTLRIDLEQLELFNHLVAELLINQNQLSLRDEQFQSAVQKLADWIRRHRLTLNQLRDLVNHSVAQSERKSKSNYKQIHPLKKLLYSALEETSQITQATEDINLLARTTTATIEREQRLSNQLRDNMQIARMVPLENLLKRFPPMVKQLSFTHKKSVDLQVQGGQVTIDKTVVDNLYDALLHLIRNAFDHGIESPEVRLQRGKSEVGNILIRAYNQGNRTIIEVRDDGEGLNVEKICQQGIKKGLIGDREAEEIQQLPQLEARLLDLLCSPGFSTVSRVSDLSGRGVGLDVVKTQLEQIKGTLRVQFIPQQGTVFSIQIRESLMNARLLICQAGRSVYGFVSNEIEQVLIPGEKVRRLAGQKMLDWHQDGQDFTIPIYELTSLFNYSRSLPQCRGLAAGEFQYQELSPILTAAENVSPILLLKGREGFIALEVDRILEEQELVIKPLSNAIAPPAYIYGCSILADGRLALIIDGFALVGQSQNKEAIAPQLNPKESLLREVVQPPTELSTQTLGLYIPESKTTEKPPETNLPSSPLVTNKPQIQQVKTILVIDDSLTERQTLTLILQRSGYRVLQAKDGLEALEQLKSKETIHVALCDIEMPRMNGLEFLSVVKQDKTLPQIPAIILTSRSRDKFQHIALELGAYAYLTKPYLEGEILGVVAEALSTTEPRHNPK